MPRAHIGPDVDARVLCASTTTVPVASVDEQGSGITSWSATIVGDPALSIAKPGSFSTCVAKGPDVASVQIVALNSAHPGDTYDGVVTVSAADRSFPTGMVKVHAVVSAPIISATPTLVEFGDVPAGRSAQRTVTFVASNATPVDLTPTASSGMFSLMRNPPTTKPEINQTWTVTLPEARPGDWAETITWRASPSPSAQADCTSVTEVRVHAHVLPASDAGPIGEAGASSSDGGD